MSVTRERFFDCSWTSEGQKRTAQVRAWTASGARRLFVDLLAADGVRDPGVISVTEARYDHAPPWLAAFAVARAGRGSRS